MAKNTDRGSYSVTDDLQPITVTSIFQSANSGSTQRQSKLATELLEKDPAMAQSWSVRVASIASCPYQFIGKDEAKNEQMRKALAEISPNYDSGLVGFKELLQNLQSAVMHGFTVAENIWDNGGSSIDGFRLYSQSLFSFVDSQLPYYNWNDEKFDISYPRWIYHTATNSRDTEPLRSGLVRPLAYLYAFRRHVLIPMLRGVEKYGLPMPFAKVSAALYEDSDERDKLANMLQNWTYDGYAITDENAVELEFPTSSANFNIETFQSYLNSSEKQIFRLILGQDSTSSADNSNRSTAQVHNLVRQDILASDALAVENTVNTQIIKPLAVALWGENIDDVPIFRFNLKGTGEQQAIAQLVATLKDAGYGVTAGELSAKLGFEVTEITQESNQEINTEASDV